MHKFRKMRQHEIEIRVRYQETDAQGRVHHANYLTYFEMGRVEFLRAMGHSYCELEASGVMLVVSEMQVQYYLPAYYDDVLKLETKAVRAKGARIEHEYRVTRGDDVLVTGKSTIACISTAPKTTTSMSSPPARSSPTTARRRAAASS